MKVYKTKTELTGRLSSLASSKKTIGLVPTMGALHRGHASLVNRAIQENDLVLVTIFVNPTQFNDPSDLDNYPQTLEADLTLLESLKVDLVFVPSSEEMYPEKDQRTFNLGMLDKVMEGKHREGHFRSVVEPTAVNPRIALLLSSAHSKLSLWSSLCLCASVVMRSSQGPRREAIGDGNESPFINFLRP